MKLRPTPALLDLTAKVAGLAAAVTVLVTLAGVLADHKPPTLLGWLLLGITLGGYAGCARLAERARTNATRDRHPDCY